MIKDLENRDILQINASIIAGALIFLTLSSIVSVEQEKITRLASIVYGLIILVIFSISSRYIIVGKKDNGIYWMERGFVGIVFASIVLIGLTALPYFANFFKSLF